FRKLCNDGTCIMSLSDDEEELERMEKLKGEEEDEEEQHGQVDDVNVEETRGAQVEETCDEGKDERCTMMHNGDEEEIVIAENDANFDYRPVRRPPLLPTPRFYPYSPPPYYSRSWIGSCSLPSVMSHLPTRTFTVSPCTFIPNLNSSTTMSPPPPLVFPPSYEHSQAIDGYSYPMYSPPFVNPIPSLIPNSSERYGYMPPSVLLFNFCMFLRSIGM
ncbi:hypothetical protein PFISCL1PPCAC_23258, partial [Pristionchus fissidentatus]